MRSAVADGPSLVYLEHLHLHPHHHHRRLLCLHRPGACAAVAAAVAPTAVPTAAATMPQVPAVPPAACFDDVLTTKANYSVCGFGKISAVTTHLCGHLVGKELHLVNSAWPGYSGGTSACAIDGVAPNLNWPSGNAPALIVRTVADGYRYAFRPDQIWPSIPRAARTLARKEMAFIRAVRAYEMSYVISKYETIPYGTRGARERGAERG
jgi:hypothetical protein